MELPVKWDASASAQTTGEALRELKVGSSKQPTAV